MQEQSLNENSRLPELRQELQIKPGAREIDGSLTWLIYDPVRHRYFQIDNKNVQLLKHWEVDSAGTLLELLGDPGITLDDIETLIRFLYVNSLTRDPAAGDIQNFTRQASAARRSWVSSALHNYLFFRIPLIRPDRFLKRTEHLTRLFFTRLWWATILLLGVSGLYLVSRQWEQFVHTFMHFFSVQGLMFYGLALVFVKILHELGHAYSATRYGCRVSTMGLAFLVMFPVLFTDTTDSWKLTSRRQRLIINGAGIAVELTIAIIATFLWAFLPDGPFRSATFFIATTSWVLSIAVNLNPLMRFDGYHFLSDLIGVQNLQTRCFNMGKWALRELLFGLDEPLPEAMSQRRRRGLILLAWATWIYRFFLFLGIAVLVHYFFFKPLGTFLAVVEVMFFIVRPIVMELKEWWQRRGMLFGSGTSWRTIIVVCALVLAMIVPWRTTLRIPAVIEAREQSPIFAVQAAQLLAMHVQQGDNVQAGDVLFELRSPDLSNQIEQAQRQLQLATAKLDNAVVDSDLLDQKVVLKREQQQLRQTIAGLEEEAQRLTITAPIEGVVTDINPDLHPGRWVSNSLKLASVISTSGARIRGFVAAEDVGRLAGGSKAVFYPDALEGRKVEGTINLIDSANAAAITIPALASTYGGPIAVTPAEQELRPLKGWYNVTIDLGETELSPERVERGQLHAFGEPESLLLRTWRRAVHVVIRETFI